MLSRYSAFAIAVALAWCAPGAHAQDATDVVKALTPGAAPATDAAPGSDVLQVKDATADEILKRLTAATITRSLGDSPKPRTITVAEGHQGETLTQLRSLQGIQVPVTFQGSSDALSPEAGGLLASLGQALKDPKLAASKFIIGVHTNAVGSDKLNDQLADLRADAIVDRLTSVYGVAKDRLVPVGFGKLYDTTQMSAPEDRIRIVNLGDMTVDTGAPAQGVSVTTAPAATEPAAGGPEGSKPAASVAPHYPRPHYVVRHRYSDPDHDGDERRHARRRYDPDHDGDAYRHARRHRYVPQEGYATANPSPSFFGGGHGGGGEGGGGGGGEGGGGWHSDRRLKRNVKLLGRSPRGFNIYSFEYVWGGPAYVGVMAQEILDVVPEAVIVGPEGFMRVDYTLLDVDMLTLDAWTARQVDALAV